MKPGLLASTVYPLRGLWHLLRHPELWPYAIAAFAVNAVLLTGLVAAAFWWRRDLASWMMPGRFPAWSKEAVGCLLSAAALVLALFLATIVGNLVAGPFLEALSARMLVALGETLPPPHGAARAILRSIANQLVKLLVFGGVQAALLVIVFTPLHAPLALLVTVVFLGFEYLDYPLEMRGVPAGARFRWLLRRPGPALGFGAVSFAATLVPLLGYAMLPASVCGATLLAHDLDG